MPGKGRIGRVFEIRRSRGELFVEWNTWSFLKLLDVDDYYESDRFCFPDACWFMEMTPNRNGSQNMSLRLRRDDCGDTKTFNIAVGLMGDDGVVRNRKQEKLDMRYNDSWEWEKFLWRGNLHSYLKKDGSLSITCELKIPGYSVRETDTQTDAEFKNAIVPIDEKISSEKQDTHTQTDAEFKEAIASIDVNLSTEKQGNGESSRKRKFLEVGEANILSRKVQAVEKAMEDFGKMLATGENSDITVQVKEAEFKLHRNILSARSPVLSAMLKEETEGDKIIMDDWEPEDFKEYLQYLYKGSVESLTDRNVFGLYRIANKLQNVDLREQCLEHIRDTLSIHTFCNVVLLALTHEESGLVDQAVAFATENIRTIIRTVEWRNFMSEHPTEANEVLIKCLGPPSVNSP